MSDRPSTTRRIITSALAFVGTVILAMILTWIVTWTLVGAW